VRVELERKAPQGSAPDANRIRTGIACRDAPLIPQTRAHAVLSLTEGPDDIRKT
jgi:hypothetical protein